MKWYYNDGSSQVGPVDESEIIEMTKSGIIKRSTMVWKEGMPAWCDAGSTELVNYMVPAPPLSTPAQNNNLQATQQESVKMTWYYNDGQTQVGPVNQSEIFAMAQSGKIKRNTMVWKEGTPAWCEAGSTELVSCMAPAPPPMNAPSQPNNLQTTRQGPVEITDYIQPKNPPRSVGWITFWGFAWPGLGQLLCGQVAKGVIFMIGAIFVNVILSITIIGPLLVMIASGIDANMVAKRHRMGMPVREWDIFPKIG